MAGGSSTRRLRVDIEGDSSGFDQVTRQATAAAEAFDRELQDLERSQREATEQADRNAAAFQRLQRAQQEAQESVSRLARGEIDEAEAARLQGEAHQQLQRVLRATAMAQRAAARAAEEQAEEQRQAAQAAEVAAGRQRLAQLRAAGATREHDRLLQQMRLRFPGLGDDGDKAFTRIGGAAKAAGTAMTSPTGGIAKFAIVLGALPWLAQAAAVGITLGLGGALVGMGLKAAASTKEVKDAFSDLSDHVKAQTTKWAKPFEDTLIKTAKFARMTFDELMPDIGEAWAKLAPAVTAFSARAIRSLEQFRPTIEAATDAFIPMMDTLGQKLPGLMGQTADGLTRIVNAADPKAFGAFIDTLGKAITWGTHFVAVLTKVSSAFLKVGPIAIAARHLDDVGSAFGKLSGQGGAASNAMSAFERTIVSANLGTGAAAAGFGLLSTSAGGMSGAMGRATPGLKAIKDGLADAADEALELDQRLKGLQDAMNAALNPSLALYNSQTQVAEGMATLRKAAQESKGALDNSSAASRAARQAFAAQIATVRDLGQNTFAATGDTKKMTAAVAAQLPALYRLAGSNKAARAQVDRLAAAFGVSGRQASGAKGRTDGLRGSISKLKGKTVPINAQTAQAHAKVAALIARWNGQTINIGVNLLGGALGRAAGGYVGYAAGGPVQGFPVGGMVHGPGTATSDSIPAMLSNGEYVVNARSTAMYRPLLEAINSGRTGGASSPRVGPRPSPAAGGGSVLHVSLSIGNRPLGELLIDPLRKSVQTRGGNVQAVLGVAGRG